jgi:hypothetical protein
MAAILVFRVLLRSVNADVKPPGEAEPNSKVSTAAGTPEMLLFREVLKLANAFVIFVKVGANAACSRLEAFTGICDKMVLRLPRAVVRLP